jgi:hypothetical protein
MFIDACGGSLESHQSYIITYRADDKIMDSGVCFFGEFDREKIKGMNPTGINSQLRFVVREHYNARDNAAIGPEMGL